MNEFKRSTGIHTFELYCRLSYDQYKNIKDSLYSLCKNINGRFYSTNDYNHSYKCTALYSDGIGISLCSRFIKLTINPSRLTDPTDINGLFSAGQRPHSITEMFQSLFSKMEQFIPAVLLPSFLISRIDYTIDSYLQSDEHVLLLIKLAKKQGLPRGFQPTYPASIRKSVNFNESFSYDISRCDRLYSVKLYAKHKQLICSRKDIPDKLLESTIGLLRAEISYTCQIPVQDTVSLITLFCLESLIDLYHDIFPLIFPYGVYLASPTAKSLLEEKYKHQRTLKKHILNFLNIVMERHTFHQAYQIFGNKNILKKDLLKCFYNVGINPVTIAINDKIIYMPSIYLTLGLDTPFIPLELSLISSL